jgi:triosephosphate isomerase
MRQLLFAANWKMHLGPQAARTYFNAFLAAYSPRADRSVWFFPPAVSLAIAAERLRDRRDMLVGAQDIHWEPKGAFTGAVSAPLALEAGAGATLIGHSERRHVFGESDEETGRKVRAALDVGLTPMLCVGERLEEREAAQTEDVVTRQLEAGLDGIGAGLSRVVIAYEPVWAIGTGLSATPSDAAAVHGVIRAWLAARGHEAATILYGGSVKTGNVGALLAEQELDGVLVGGASLDPAGWAAIAQTEVSRLAS